VAYDFMIQAMGGLMSVTGAPDGEPGGGPQKVGVPIVDIMTGMYAAIAVLAALVERSQSGKGDTIDIAMLDVATAMLANQAMNQLVSGETPIRRGNKHPNIQPQDVFPVRDGHIVLAVGNDEQFQRFAAAIERPDLSDDPRYATNRERVKNLDTLHPLICTRLGEKDLADWIKIFGARKVPCGPINTVPMVFANDQVRHRRMLRDLPHSLSGTVPTVVSPLRFDRAALSFDRPPPLLGEHTKEVLAKLGLSTANTA
jgi:crotonobetainyl-CoA:carnitine CoA-transferase CaiB-like acyl-CoA transferase